MIHVGATQYHTPSTLAASLVSYLPDIKVKRAIDICCGSWNLLSEVKKRWEKAGLVGIDLDVNAGTKRVKGGRFLRIDGREYAIGAFKSNKSFDLVVANPPFGKIESEQRYEVLYDIAGIKSSGHAITRIETEMVIANSLLVRDNGYLLIIVPNSLIESDSFTFIRSYLNKNFIFKNIIKLPINAFGRSEIRSYALILKKNVCNNGDNIPSMSILQKCEAGQWRKSYFESDKIVKLPNDKEDLKKGIASDEICIFRGTISSKSFTETGIPILHTAAMKQDFNTWAPGIRYVQPDVLLNSNKFAITGDYIVSRVGRSAGFWCRYTGPKIAVSDCLFVIKNKEDIQFSKILEALSRQQRLEKLLKGLTTLYITQNELVQEILIEKSRTSN